MADTACPVLEEAPADPGIVPEGTPTSPDDNLRRFLDDPQFTLPADSVEASVGETSVGSQTTIQSAQTMADLVAMAAAAQGVENDGDENPEEYNISTPLSWSDNGSFIESSSIAGMSTSDLSKVFPSQSSPVPKELLDIIERQDTMIDCLVKWCKNLEETNQNHQIKLEEHEQLKSDYNSMRAKLRTELFTLKAEANRKAKAHSAEASALYDKIQAKVDARVHSLVASHEVVKTREVQHIPKVKNMPGSSPLRGPKQPEPRELRHANRIKSNATPTKRVPTGPSSKGVSASMSNRSSLNLSKREPQGSPRREPQPQGSPRREPQGSPRKSTGSKLNNNSQRSSMAPETGRSHPGSVLIERCFERSASPDASRVSKRYPGQGLKSPTPVKTQRQVGEGSQSSFGSANREMQKSIREAASPQPSTPRSINSPRNGLGAASRHGPSYKFIPRSVSPPTGRLGSDRASSPNLGRASSPNVGGRASSPNVGGPTRRSGNHSPRVSQPRQSRSPPKSMGQIRLTSQGLSTSEVGHLTPPCSESSLPSTPTSRGGLMSTLAAANASLGSPTSSYTPPFVSSPPGSSMAMLAQHAAMSFSPRRSMPPACVAFQSAGAGLSSPRLLDQASSFLERQHGQHENIGFRP